MNQISKYFSKELAIGIALIAILIAIQLSGICPSISIETIKRCGDSCTQFAQAHFGLSVAAYIGLYALLVALALPTAMVLAISGGYLFGTVQGALFANIGATLGSTIAFLCVRYVLGKGIQQKYHAQLTRFNAEIKRNGMIYLLLVHCIAVIPLFVINILAGLTSLPLWTFVWTTSLGMLPSMIIYAFAGTQLQTINSIRDIFSFKIIFGLILFKLLSLLPIVIQYMRRNRQHSL